MVKTYRIHPAIGIARVGNSDEYFLAPESVDDPPLAEYKPTDKSLIKRQAVRFRVFEYVDGVPVREVTHQVGDDQGTDGGNQEKIVWRVHLANRKAAFGGRNKEVTNRRKLIIDAGLETISGQKRGPFTMAGTFQCQAPQPTEVVLGQLHTDEAGRLIVAGGKGRSFSPTGAAGSENSIYWDDWCDDTSDGPVSASVHVPGTGWVEAESAWVVVAPPDFAPGVQPKISLFDTVYQIAIEKFGCHYDPLLAAGIVSFKRHVYPLLERAARQWWVIEDQPQKNYLDPPVLKQLKDNRPEAQLARQKVWDELQKFFVDPGEHEAALQAFHRDGQEGKDLPAELAAALPIQPWRRDVMERWRDGRFESDWENPLPESFIFALDKAMLDRCFGHDFNPGVELPDNIQHPATWKAPFRIDGSALAPGDVTARLAIPWQADYYICENYWPAVRPSEVFSAENPSRMRWARGVKPIEDMVQKWAKLGFVLREGTGEKFLERERDEFP